MLLIVTSVSSLVHIYSLSWRRSTGGTCQSERMGRAPPWPLTGQAGRGGCPGAQGGGATLGWTGARTQSSKERELGTPEQRESAATGEQVQSV